MDYICLPEWLPNEKHIKSEIVRKFIKYASAEGNKKIDMKYLRKYYCEEKETYIKLVDELALRGFKFITSKPNNILPKNINSKEIEYILVDKQEANYKNINYEKIGISDFMNRFMVSDNLFFNYIPIQGFWNLNKNIDIEQLKDEFKNNGFNIDYYSYDKDICYEQKDSYDSENNNLIERKKIYLDKEKNMKIDNIMIEELDLSPRSYNALKRAKIQRVKQLIELDYEKLISIRNMGKKSVSEILDKIEQIKANGVMSSLPQKKIDLIDLNVEKTFMDELGFSVRAQNALLNYGVREFIQLDRLSYKEISEIKNLGKKTVDEIFVKIDKWKNSDNYRNEVLDSYINISQKILDVFGKCLLSNIYDNKEYKILRELTINDLKELSYRELENLGIPFSVIITLKSNISELEPPKKILDSIEFKERDEIILKRRYLFGETLEEIGECVDVTRERVRQIIKKEESKMFSNLRRSKFIYNFKLAENIGITFSRDVISSGVCNDDLKLALLEKSKYSVVKYYEPFDIFFTSSKNEFEKDIWNVLQECPDQFNLVDIIDEVLEVCTKYDINNLDISNIENLILDNGFTIYGEIISKKKFCTVDALSIIFREYIDEPFKVNDVTVAKCCELAKEYLGFDLPQNSRAFESRLRDVEDIILVERRTFFHINKIDYDLQLIEYIDKYLMIKSQEVQSISIDEIFEKFIVILKENNIRSKILLYSLIKRHLGDKYDIGKGNTLNIYFDESKEKVPFRTILYDYIKVNGGRVKKTKIVESLGWTNIRLENTIINYQEFISLGNGLVKIYERKKMDDQTEKYLRDFIKEKIKKGYICVEKVYIDMKFDGILNKFILENDIENSINLAQILKILFPNLVGHTILLFDRSTGFRNTEDLIISKYDRVYKEELKQELINLGHKEMTAYTIMFKLLERKKYVEIASDEIVLKSNFKIETNVIKSVISYVKSKMNSDPYISLYGLSGYRSKLPKIQYRWNPHLIRTILLSNGFRDIKKKVKDYRTDRLIMVEENNDLISFEELVFQLIKDGYDGNMHQSHIYDFLVEKNLLLEKENILDKKLPAEIRECELINIDSVGKVSLKGD
ncbi:DNA-directed RNA polymerase subunit alpha C-terminal domain-containing protein [Clostridium sp. DL1XJH146]